LKTRNPIRIFVGHDNVDVDAAGKIRNLLLRHLDAKISLGADFVVGDNWPAKLRAHLKTVDVVAALLTPHSIGSTEVLQQVGMAYALEKPILPLVSRRDLLNRFTIALRPNMALELGDIDSPEGAERFAAAFESAIAIAHAA
jgi:hypothetical protein